MTQMIEYQKLINNLRCVRLDLSEKTITEEVNKQASSSTSSVTDVLHRCIRLGQKGKPMPWEPDL